LRRVGWARLESADDFTSPQGAAYRRPAHCTTSRIVGVLPGCVRCATTAFAGIGCRFGRCGVPVSPSYRPLLAEFVGTALLVTVVVGSGIAAAQLSPDDVGLQLLENSTATVFGLAVLILMFGPVSGAHFNPLVSAADWLLGRRAGTGITATTLGLYIVVQSLGGICGAVLANVMFDRRAFELATKDRITLGHLIGEVVATAGLITLIFALARTGRAAMSAAAVGAYICAAYWFTSSTSFANPAVTIGRMFSDSFAGIAPGSAPGFIAAQVVGTLLGLALIVVLYPGIAVSANDVVVPHEHSARHVDVDQGSLP